MRITPFITAGGVQEIIREVELGLVVVLIVGAPGTACVGEELKDFIPKHSKVA